MAQLLRTVLRPVARVVRVGLLHSDILCLKLSNRFSSQSVTSIDGPVVSIASYGRRVATSYLTMESIARGDLRPARLLLWLDNPAEFANLPIQLKRLQARGLEVKFSDRNYGPHTKYYPYVISRSAENGPGSAGPLVTADDDIVYPKGWLRGLQKAHEQAPSLVHCHRARVVQVSDTGLQPYSTWQLCRSTEPSFLKFALGVSGVIYPPQFLKVLEQAGAGFETKCPKADDLWLHKSAIQNGFRIRQLGINPIHFPMIPGTQADGLLQQNLHNHGNDEQIAKTYGPTEVLSLNREQEAQSKGIHT